MHLEEAKHHIQRKEDRIGLAKEFINDEIGKVCFLFFILLICWVWNHDFFDTSLVDNNRTQGLLLSQIINLMKLKIQRSFSMYAFTLK